MAGPIVLLRNAALKAHAVAEIDRDARPVGDAFVRGAMLAKLRRRPIRARHRAMHSHAKVGKQAHLRGNDGQPAFVATSEHDIADVKRVIGATNARAASSS